MTRLNISNLNSQPKFRNAKYAGAKISTYGPAKAAAEDQYRPAAIKRSIKRLLHTYRKAAKRLARKLNYVGKPPATLASAAYHYDVREPLLDHLVRLAQDVPEDQLMTGALLPRGSRISRIHVLHAFRFLERLRQDLRRAGGGKAKGWLFAGIHCEFNLGRWMYDPHYHIIVAGREMIAVVEALRDKGKYKLGNDREMGGLSDKAPPIRLRQVNRTELRYALSYAFQSWFPERWEGVTPTGEQKRSKRRRLSGARHTEMLLWLDQQQPHRMVLLFHLEVGRHGLRVTGP